MFVKRDRRGRERAPRDKTRCGADVCSGPMLLVSPTVNNLPLRVSSLNFRYQSEMIGGGRLISRSGSSRGKKGFPRPEREAPRHPRATSRGIVQQHFPGPRSHSMNFAGLRSTQAFLTHLPRINLQFPCPTLPALGATDYEVVLCSLLSPH